jgi:hypothetical protein
MKIFVGLGICAEAILCSRESLAKPKFPTLFFHGIKLIPLLVMLSSVSVWFGFEKIAFKSNIEIFKIKFIGAVTNS